MKRRFITKTVQALIAATLTALPLWSKDMGNTFSSEFKIKSRTSFGIDLDNPFNSGLKQELIDFSYVMHIGPGYASNQFNSNGPVGFINFSVYDIAISPVTGDRTDSLEASSGNGSFYNYWDSGRFLAGLAWNNWLLSLNGKNTESFWLPWNKTFEMTNDKIRVSWASMDTMVGAVRTKRIVGTQPLDSDVKGEGVRKWNGKSPTYLVQQDDGTMDKLHFAVDGEMVGLMYTWPEIFGVNAKFATENAFDSGLNSVHDYNGVAFGLDFVFTPGFAKAPAFLKPLKIMGSAAGTWNYGADHDDDPIAAGIKASYKFQLNEDMAVEPFFGVDMGVFLMDDKFALTTVSGNSKIQYKTGLDNASTTLPGGGYEFSAGVAVHWPGQGGWLKDYITGDNGRVFPGMALAYSFYDNPYDSNAADSSFKFTLYEPTGYEGVLYFLGSEVIADLRKVGTADWEFMFTGYLDCPLDMVIKHGLLTPFVTMYYDNVPCLVGENILRQNALKTDIGVKLTELIPNTELKAIWNSGNLIKDEKTDAESTSGFFRICAEISF